MKRKLPKLKKPILTVINLPLIICNHVLGEEHHIVHRITVGVGFMFIGVFIARIESAFYILSISYEAAGYVVHAIGVIPIVETMFKKSAKPPVKKTVKAKTHGKKSKS